MEWLLLSVVILVASFGTTGAVLYYAHHFYEQRLQQRLLREKQLKIYEEISSLVGTVKSTLELSSGEETLREWRQALMEPLKEILTKSYQWSIFLPSEVATLPAQYASKVAHSLVRLDGLATAELSVIAEAIEGIKKIEQDNARMLEQKIRQLVGSD